MSPRGILKALPSALLVALVFACGGGGGGGGPVPNLRCSGSLVPGADEVTLSCPADGVDSITISVLLGGPTTSSDIYGLKFDLLFDPTVVRFEPSALAGSFLSQDGASTIVRADAAEGDPGRLIVAITRQSEPAGVRGAAAVQGVMTLLFRGVLPGDTTVAFENAEAVDSDLAPIPEIEFGTPLTLTFE